MPSPSSGFGGFQGAHPGQSSTAFPEKFVDVPVPGGLLQYGELQGFLPAQGSAQRNVEQNVDSPVLAHVLVEVFMVFPPDMVLSRLVEQIIVFGVVFFPVRVHQR